MATECYSGTYALPLPPLTATCPPDDGICFSSLSLGEGEHTAQFGCWPSQTASQLGWYGVPECKHDVGRHVCLCLQSLCNRLPPSPREMHPEWGEVQGLTLLFMILLIPAFLFGVVCCLRKYVKRSFVRECINIDVEHGDNVFEMVSLHNQSSIVNIQDQSHMVSLRYQSPSSPLFHESPAQSSQDSTVPTLVRRNSAPGYMSCPAKTT